MHDNFSVNEDATLVANVLVNDTDVDTGDSKTVVNFTVNGNTLHVTAPKYEGIALGGYYMLFAVNSNGVPAMGKKIQVGNYISQRK